MESGKKILRRVIINFFFSLSSLPIFASAPHFEEIEDTCELKIHTPSLSCRKTAKIRLANGLMLYLISDEKADASSAALSVGVGHWNDPREFPGMAHLVEHLLFMGSKSYPRESGFMSFISDHGGKTNAYTAPDRTVFLFSSHHDGYLEALDQFSHFFIDPLLNQNSIKNELQSVDQEHAKNIENDFWRKYMILKETGNPNHPNRNFSTGNSETLSHIPNEVLRNWFENNYSANLMHAVLYSSLPMDELKEKAVSLFSQIPNRALESLSVNDSLLSKQKAHLIAIKPVKNLQILSLEWELPLQLVPDETKSAKLIAYALRRGSENSLAEQLKREGLIQEFDVSIETLAKKNILFSMHFELTNKGIAERNTIIERSFQTLKSLMETGIPLYLYQEMIEMAKRGYEFQTREDPFYFVMDQIGHIREEELTSFPQKTLLPTNYDPKKIQAFLRSFNPRSCQYFLMADPEKTKISPQKKERWMGAEYAAAPIPEELLSRWEKVSSHPEIRLPPVNPFIPTSLTLKDASEGPFPQNVIENSYAKVYYFQDLETPEVHLFLHLQSPNIFKTSKSFALTDLYLKHLEESLHPLLSAASAAGLFANFSFERLRINIELQGYSEKAGLFLQKIVKHMKDRLPSKREFQNYIDSLERDYANTEKDLPLAQSYQLLSSLLHEKPTAKEKLSALTSITYEEFLQFHKTLFQTAFLEALLAGNLTVQDAEVLILDTIHTFGFSPYPKEKRPSEKILSLPPSQGPFVSLQSTSAQGNSALLLMEEGSFSFETRANQQILAVALKEAFFDTLRTKQKTGYIVQSSEQELNLKLFQTFSVQSNTHNPHDLLFRFELFLENFCENIRVLISEERFDNIRKNLITTLEKDGRSLEERAKRTDLLAFQYNADFDWILKRIQGLKDLSYDSFMNFSLFNLSKENRKRLAILFQGKTKEFSYEPISFQKLKEMNLYEEKTAFR